MTRVPAYLEVGSKRVFALALDWPGWARPGKDRATALAALGGYAQRYAAVAAEAGLSFPGSPDLAVVEEVAGSATTDFGAPGAAAAGDLAPLGEEEADRIARLLTASWKVLTDVAASSPEELRKGPRGGGRDRTKMLAHVLEAEVAYAQKLGIRGAGTPAPDDAAAVASLRGAILGAIRAGGAEAGSGKSWPARYAARRIAWHVLDHAWEMEDRRP